MATHREDTQRYRLQEGGRSWGGGSGLRSTVLQQKQHPCLWKPSTISVAWIFKIISCLGGGWKGVLGCLEQGSEQQPPWRSAWGHQRGAKVGSTELNPTRDKAPHSREMLSVCRWRSSSFLSRLPTLSSQPGSSGHPQWLLWHQTFPINGPAPALGSLLSHTSKRTHFLSLHSCA